MDYFVNGPSNIRFNEKVWILTIMLPLLRSLSLSHLEVPIYVNQLYMGTLQGYMCVKLLLSEQVALVNEGGGFCDRVSVSAGSCAQFSIESRIS